MDAKNQSGGQIRMLSNSFAFFLVGQLFGHTLALFRAWRLLGDLGGLTGQAGRAYPSAAFTAPRRLIRHAWFGAEDILTARANHLGHRIEDFQIFGRSNMAHRFAGDCHAVLESFFGGRHCEYGSPPGKARFYLRCAFDFPLITNYLMPHEGSVLEADFVDYFCHMDLTTKNKTSSSIRAQRLSKKIDRALNQRKV